MVPGMHVLVTGSSGLVGSTLVKKLSAQGHQVTRAVRRTPRPGEIRWDPDHDTIETGAIQHLDAVVHLAGAGIGDHRWTDEYKRTLVESRTRGTGLIASTIAGLEHKPSVLLSASAVGYYGDTGDTEVDESSPAGTGFLADLCVQWEQATAPAEQAGVRVAHLRTGIVLSDQGGALKKQLPLFKLGVGGRIGSGKPWQSWISLEDEIGAIVHLLTNATTGAVNLTAPNPVTQADFANELGKALHRPTFLPIPSFGPKLLLGGELVDNLLLAGQRVLPSVLLGDGYVFAHPTLPAAFASILGR